MVKKHICSGLIERVHQPLARSDWVAKKIKGHLLDQPKIKAKDIVKDVQHDHRVRLSYIQAWRGKEVAREMIDESHKQQYHDLPLYIEKIRRTNPGTEVRIHIDEGKFKRLFITYRPCIMGFVSECRPLIGINGTFLKGKYQGILLCTIAVDANNGFFLLALAAVENENYQSWYWFLSILSELLNRYLNLPALTIISHRQKSLPEAIEKCFPTCFPSFCMQHMGKNFKGFMKRSANTEVLLMLFWKAARKATIGGFEKIMFNIQCADLEAYDWIKNIPPKFWADAYFSGSRYSHLTSNVAEYFNAWILSALEKPIITMCQEIKIQLMARFEEKRELGNTWSGMLVLKAQ
ncbi:uncharacterized protein LOC105421579 [Amborella trichopoda]|uniref:uncharacterized protein LOC105421579 n=1 Tax=Amborella trichopoda TaxID=13333 RepID=UPI0005D31914|nr:uncharacterized protein LOC105421579 [Amborella trichopoda]|eukprot:XP_011627784.1 uncharacterized protein LOC105421579 [Amborella trichopoda]